MRYQYLIISGIVALIAFLYSPTAGFASILGSSDQFAVLAGSTVTNTGKSTVIGDLGVDPGTAVTGLADIALTGTVYTNNGVALAAQNDLTTAYNDLAGMPVNTVLTGQDLNGLILAPGVYNYSSSALLTGTLTLDAQGNNNAYWVFQIHSALTVASNSAVNFVNLGTNNGLDNGVFWQVGSSASLGTGTAFKGNILADQSITLETGASILDGRALARIGAVTMDTNTITKGLSGGLIFDNLGNILPVGPSQGTSAVPEPATITLLGLGLLGLGFKKNKVTG